MNITNRARRIGRAVVASRYRSEREQAKIIAGKLDDNPNVIDATRAAQATMDELLPCLAICEIALDSGNVAVMRVNASMIKDAIRKD